MHAEMMVVDDADLTWTSKRIGACNAQLESHGRRLSLATLLHRQNIVGEAESQGRTFDF